jgi:phosphatidylserine/phosphatidylglycerophosphate/cardiolipin synthase-like enzyme
VKIVGKIAEPPGIALAGSSRSDLDAGGYSVNHFSTHRFSVFPAAAIFFTFVAAAGPAQAAERLCDPSFENCRTELLTLINNETKGIDVGFWFMEDPRYVTAILARHTTGVPVRILVDPRGSQSAPANQTILDSLAAGGVPMRKRTTAAILHWKMMLFAGQGVVEFSGANYSEEAWKPFDPYKNYVDESIYFTDAPAIVESFMTKFDSSWVDTASFANYANVTGTLSRRYPKYPIAPELNFPPGSSYATRAINLYAAEPAAIDVIMFRITQQSQSDAMIAAHKRGVVVRLITEPSEYRNRARLWDSWNVDRMWKAGIQIRVRAHAGLNHQKSVVLHGLRTVIFGSSNWTSPSDDSQQEHNYFVGSKPWMYTWFVQQFTRKWFNANPIGAAETKAFTPLPPDQPKYKFPANAAFNQGTTVTLKWYGGPWAHYYDIYFGTSSTPPLVVSNKYLGPSESSTQYQKYALPTLTHGKTYYWRIVSRTAAGKTTAGPIWSFSA